MKSNGFTILKTSLDFLEIGFFDHRIKVDWRTFLTEDGNYPKIIGNFYFSYTRCKTGQKDIKFYKTLEPLINAKLKQDSDLIYILILIRNLHQFSVLFGDSMVDINPVSLCQYRIHFYDHTFDFITTDRGEFLAVDSSDSRLPELGRLYNLKLVIAENRKPFSLLTGSDSSSSFATSLPITSNAGSFVVSNGLGFAFHPILTRNLVDLLVNASSLYADLESCAQLIPENSLYCDKSLSTISYSTDCLDCKIILHINKTFTIQFVGKDILSQPLCPVTSEMLNKASQSLKSKFDNFPEQSLQEKVKFVYQFSKLPPVALRDMSNLFKLESVDVCIRAGPGLDDYLPSIGSFGTIFELNNNRIKTIVFLFNLDHDT